MVVVTLIGSLILGPMWLWPGAPPAGLHLTRVKGIPQPISYQ
jgi:hypothetical protein